MQDQNDVNFFEITISGNELLIKAVKQGRFTHLNVIYKEKGKSNIDKEINLILLSNTTDIQISNFTKNKIGESSIDSDKYVGVGINSSEGLSSTNKTNDLVIPSKVVIDSITKEVGSYNLGQKAIYIVETFIYRIQFLIFPQNLYITSDVMNIYVSQIQKKGFCFAKLAHF